MKKYIFLIYCFFIITPDDDGFAQSKSFDLNPNRITNSLKKNNNLNLSNQSWELLFNYALDQSVDNSGAVYIPDFDEIWVSKFASDYFFILGFIDDTLSYFYEVTIDGVRNVRGMTFNGSYIYAGNNTDSILVIDPFNEILVGYIIAPQPVRYVTFDPSANNNNGGLWVGNLNYRPYFN